jgi:hypothetical protein|tara:strand:+ start:467 stop:799 length:333 start_codon:yes stop_codon:yes gene_type:complete
VIENIGKNERFSKNKIFLQNFHNEVLNKGVQGKEGEKVVTMKIVSVGDAPDRHYLLPAFDPQTGEVIVDNDKILDKYRSLIESGEIQSYKNPIEAEKDRVIMYKEIIGVE